MNWKLYCDRCDGEIEDKTTDGGTVFNKEIAGGSLQTGKVQAVITIRAEINNDDIALCLNCVREVLGPAT